MVISCTIQGVLTILLGPCLLAGYSFLPKRLQAKLRDLQHEFLVATSFLSISLSVATLVYFLETARPFELSFLYYLATMQFFALFTVWFTATRPYYNEPRMHSRNFFMICTGTFIYAVSTVLMFVTVFTGSAIPEFLSACVNYDVERSDLIRAFEGDWVMTARSAKGIITCVFTVAWIVGARVLLDFAHAWRCHQQLCTLIAGGAATAMIVFIVRMERSREMVRALVGQEDYVSDNWGLGHILTIFIWFPILLKLIWILVQTNRFTEPPISRRVSTQLLSPSSGFGCVAGPVLTFG